MISPLRKRPAPSPRNLEIYREVVLLGHTQAEAAAGRNISRRRVAQICRQVEAWRRHSAAATSERESQRRDCVERMEEVFCRALRLAGRSLDQLAAEPTDANHRSAVQGLKVAMNTARSIARMEGRAVAPAGSAGSLESATANDEPPPAWEEAVVVPAEEAPEQPQNGLETANRTSAGELRSIYGALARLLAGEASADSDKSCSER